MTKTIDRLDYNAPLQGALCYFGEDDEERKGETPSQIVRRYGSVFE